MADSAPEPAFTVDAAKILAKLHRGACETHANVKFFNAGVVGDEKIAPAACEKSKISFNTALKQCEVGVVVEDEIGCKFKYSAEDIKKKAADEKKDADEKAKITDNPDQKTNESRFLSFMQFLAEDDKKEGEQAKPGQEPSVDPLAEPKDASDEVKKMVKENSDEVQKAVDAVKKTAVAYLQDYMKVFAGEAQSKKIDEKSVVAVQLLGDSDPYKIAYKDGAIPSASDEDLKKDWQEQLKKEPNTKTRVVRGLCFKASYSLDMES